MPDSIRIVALLSGGGTTLQNLIDRIAAGALRARVVGVVASRADAFGVTRAERAGLPVRVVRAAPKRTSFPDEVWAAVREFEPDLVCLAGWLHLLPIPAEFRHRVLNIHPSLLPAFGGKGMYGHHVHAAVLDYGAKVTGCTVHFADDTYDTGPIVVQRCVPVLDSDTPEVLAERVFRAECEAYPEAIRLLAEGRVTVQNRRVVVAD
ncbi:MAG TPA: phosphoribosylglycinamide formyltransferase [Gemmata sp.]